MNQTLKIAAGVFIGVIAAFLAIKSPGWIKEWNEESQEAQAREVINGLTPNKLIAKCGKPLEDEVEGYGDTVDRRLAYKDFIGGTVWLHFLHSKAKDEKDDNWTFATMLDPADPEKFTGGSRSSVIWLPCLNSR
jgi:hypothetical protein